MSVVTLIAACFALASCGMEEQTYSALSFRMERESTYENEDHYAVGLTYMYEGTGADIVIPTIKDGIPVTEINEEGFSNQDVSSKLTTITVPEGIKKIGKAAFKNCAQLSSITLPSTLESIEADAFVGTAYYNNPENWSNGALYIGTNLIALSDTAVSGDVFTLREDTTCIAYGVFANEKELKEVRNCENLVGLSENVFSNCDALSFVFGSKIKRIGKDVLSSCDSLTSITIPVGAERIESGAFGYCKNLKTVTIPDSVKFIGEGAFVGSAAVEKQNGMYIVDGWLLESGNYYVGEQLKSDYVDISEVEDVVIPEGIRGIAVDCLRGFKSIKKLTIPASVKSICNFATESGNQNSLEVVYSGTKEEWGKIYNSDCWKRYTNIATISCSDGDIEK